MRSFIKVIRYIGPYWSFAFMNILFNVLSACFALFSFVMAVPFLRILFEKQPMVTESVPFAFSVDALQHNFNFYLSNIIVEYGQSRALLFVSLLVVIMTLFKAMTKFLAQYYMTPVRTGVVRDLRNNLYDKIMKLPLSYYSDARKGDIISRSTLDVNEVEASVMSSLEMIFRDPITIIIFLTYMFIMSYQLTLLAIILLPVSGYLIGRVGRTLRAASFKGQRRMGTLMSIIEETLTGIRIIKAYNAEKKVTRHFRSANNLYTMILNKVYRRRFLASPMSEFLGTVVMMLLMYVGGILVLRDITSLSSEGFIAYLIVFSQIITPAKAFSTGYYNIQKGMAAVDRIDSVIKAEVVIRDKPDARPIQEFAGSIEYRDVYFRYEKDYVLKNINLQIHKGRTVALVGKSGSGKSTLVDLLPRFIDCTKGKVMIDGLSVRDYRIKDLRNLMGIVSQQSILFNDTFFNNIAFGMYDARESDVIEAAKMANAHEFIMETGNGYYTNVGDAGSKLSGGQRQRISIARALLKNPPVLILDEATSSLDTESERLVQEAIVNLMQNRTSIVIAHRLSTVKFTDEIFVLEAGEIVEHGNHEELLARDGYYRKFHKMQMY